MVADGGTALGGRAAAVREPDAEVVTLGVPGAVVGWQAELLWADIEETLERACGRPVEVDLSRVTTFDHAAVRELVEEIRACARRHVELRVLVRAHSALDQYLCWYAQASALTLRVSSGPAPGTSAYSQPWPDGTRASVLLRAAAGRSCMTNVEPKFSWS
jgi:ABC-type transporter Mla MlaB component